MPIDGTRYIGRIEGELFTRYRHASGRYRAADLVPRTYGQNEVEQIVREYWNVLGEIIREFDLDESRTWDASPATGVVYYTKDG